MRSLKRWMMIVAAVGFFGTATPVSAQEEDIPLDKVPKVIMDAVKEKFPGAELKGASTEKDDEGKQVYEVAFIYKKAHHDVTYTPEGKLVLVEKEVEAKDLPKAVIDALIDKYPGATVKLAEEMIDPDGKVKAYEMKIVTADQKVLEVKFDPDGKVVK